MEVGNEEKEVGGETEDKWWRKTETDLGIIGKEG